MSAHEQFADDLALYALGCLEGDEKTRWKSTGGVRLVPSRVGAMRGDAALLALSASGPGLRRGRRRG